MFQIRLKHLRTKYGLTQKILAEKLNMQNTAISKYELNERNPDLDTLNNIANFFDVSVDYLLGRTDVPNPYSTTNDYLDHKVSEDIQTLSPESQEEIKKLIKLYRIRDMQNKNSEMADELTSIE